MTTESLKETFQRELPDWLRQDPGLRAYILDLARREFANSEETQDRLLADPHHRVKPRVAGEVTGSPA